MIADCPTIFVVDNDSLPCVAERLRLPGDYEMAAAGRQQAVRSETDTTKMDNRFRLWPNGEIVEP